MSQPRHKQSQSCWKQSGQQRTELKSKSRMPSKNQEQHLHKSGQKLEPRLGQDQGDRGKAGTGDQAGLRKKYTERTPESNLFNAFISGFEARVGFPAECGQLPHPDIEVIQFFLLRTTL